MVVWGGMASAGGPNDPATDTGGLYDPVADTWTSMSTVNAPAARAKHTAVWTGTRMVVWGGEESGGATYLKTGGVYDPATDTWAAVATTDAPSARTGHTAVWTGSRMVVWGGNTGHDPTNTGGVYEPNANAWTPVSTVAPTARYEHTALWTGTRMVVWGGVAAGEQTNTGGVYDPVVDAWAATSTVNAPPQTDRHAAVWTGDRMIVWGGSGPGGLYDPAANTWASLSVGPSGSGNGDTAVWTGTRLVVWSANTSMGGGGVYDPNSDRPLYVYRKRP